MWLLFTFIALNILSGIMYLFMHKQILKTIKMQQHTFHFRNKTTMKSNPVKKLLVLYLSTVIGIVIYTSYLYIVLHATFA